MNEVITLTGRKSRQGDARCGAFIVIVGPDGVGKTTLAQAIMQAANGPTVYFHFRPSLFRKWNTVSPHQSGVNPFKRPAPDHVVLGWARLVRSFCLSWLAHHFRVEPARKKGVLVIADRWIYGYCVQPRALRFWGPPSLALAMVRALPRPTLVVNLHAPAAVIRSRKPELQESEISAELDAWRALPVPSIVHLDATRAPGEIARSIVAHLASRQPPAQRYL
jgi:thymidylate kinase